MGAKLLPGYCLDTRRIGGLEKCVIPRQGIPLDTRRIGGLENGLMKRARGE